MANDNMDHYIQAETEDANCFLSGLGKDWHIEAVKCDDGTWSAVAMTNEGMMLYQLSPSMALDTVRMYIWLRGFITGLARAY